LESYKNKGHNPVSFITLLLRRRSIGLLLAGGLPFAAFATTSTETQMAGVGNFEKLNDHVYRGAQPTDEGFRNLAKLGIKTVIDLQPYGDARSLNEEKTVKMAGMQYINVGMKGMETLPEAGVAKVLALLEDTTTGPIFVHCHRGADRTGGVIACYRIEHDHWANDKALAEARNMGMSWFQLSIQHSVLRYQPKVNGGEVLARSQPSDQIVPVSAPAVIAATTTIQ
jgi:tyrosine-protein phosphatase SIW14